MQSNQNIDPHQPSNSNKIRHFCPKFLVFMQFLLFTISEQLVNYSLTQPITIFAGWPVYSGSCWSLACPLNAVQSEQTTKELVAKAQATTKTYKTICHTIAGNIYHWYRALDFTSNNHGKTACRSMKKIAVHKEHKQDLGLYGFRHRLSCVHENSQTGA